MKLWKYLNSINITALAANGVMGTALAANGVTPLATKGLTAALAAKGFSAALATKGFAAAPAKYGLGPVNPSEEYGTPLPKSNLQLS